MSACAPPAGDVTLMFTDIEGSTRSWEKYQERFHGALERHNALIRRAIIAWGGYEVKTAGDSFMIAFATPLAAALCAVAIQRALETDGFPEIEGLRVRIGIHCGELEPRGGDYYGPPVNRAARIENAGHGGMILLSEDASRRIRDELPPEATLADIGLHRLKDLGASQRLFRLIHPDLPERDYPPLRTLDALLHNFPAQMTSFVGRQQETEELKRLIYLDKARLITLTGSGGTGKTRLAMQVAADTLQHYPDGVWLVELASVSDPAEVPTAIALALHIPLESDADARAQVLTFLRDRKCLLTLDNFEQVIEAARFVSDLLRACPQVVCLITSRQLLQIAGEREFPVAPLGLPPADVSLETCLNYESMRLFIERGQAVRPDFTLTPETIPAIATLCHRLEGIPLAIELTARLVRGMTPQQILPRLDNRFRLLETTRRDLEPRQRSLRGAIDWSYDLLSEDERALFAELSVFAGGFFIEDAEAICTTPDALTRVFDLRDKSLLKMDEALGETRYSMLETLREYAREKLEQQGQLLALRQRHAVHFLQKAEHLAEQIAEGDTVAAIQRMTVDIDNMRAGMVWAEAQREPALIADYSMALARYFLRRGPYTDAERWLKIAEDGERSLAATEDETTTRQEDSHTHKLAFILLRRGLIHYKRAEYNEALPYFEECLESFRRVGNQERVVAALSNLGAIAYVKSRYEQARTRWEEALSLVRAHKMPRHEGDLLTNLAALSDNQGETAQARAYFEEAIVLLRRNGDQEGLAYACMNYGEMLLRTYEDLSPNVQDAQAATLLGSAGQNLEESQQLFEAMGNSEGIGQMTERLGVLALLQKNAPEAERLCRRALRLGEEYGDRRCQVSALRDLGRIALGNALASSGETEDREAQFQEAARFLNAALTIAEELQDAAEVASVLRRAGELAEARGESAAAYLAYGVSLREYQRLQQHCSPTLREARGRVGTALSATIRQEIETRAAQIEARQAAQEAFGAVGVKG